MGERFTLIAIEGVLTWRWGRNIIVAFSLGEIVLNLRADEIGRVLEDRPDDVAWRSRLAPRRLCA